jgi:hypothetical protein
MLRFRVRLREGAQPPSGKPIGSPGNDSVGRQDSTQTFFPIPH